MLSHEQAREFYDRFGSKQDRQRFYEDPAFDQMILHADFENARSVFELGCGTGRLARRLLENRLRQSASYLGVDVSSAMVGLARERLEGFGSRVRVRQTAGTLHLEEADESFDRFISTYVLDLLSVEDIEIALSEAHRVLVSGGLLGLASLTHSQGVGSRLIERVWMAAHSLRPAWVGGCRPIRIEEYLREVEWKIVHVGQVCRYGLCSQVAVARKNSGITR